MRVDLGLILGILLEWIFFIYYADTIFYRKQSKPLCYGILFLGFFVHFLGCTLGNMPLNLTISIIINILGFWFCYHTKWQQAVVHGCLLVTLSLAGEGVVAFFPPIGVALGNLKSLTPEQSLIITLVGKTLYLIGILLVKYLWNRNENADRVPQKWIVLISGVSVAIFLLLFQLHVRSVLLVIACILLITANVFVLLMHKEVTAKNLEKEEKERIAAEVKFFREEYLLLEEKYDKISILHHDFKAHMEALKNFIQQGNQEEAVAYIDTFCAQEQEAQMMKYTNHNVLNMLLSKKKTECEKAGIDFQMEHFGENLSFMDNMDCVSLFSNLLQNAVEGAKASEAKKIRMYLSMKNEKYLCIRVENSADIAPIVINDKLFTSKKNKDMHGIGMRSMQKVVQKYRGFLAWNYDETNKIFTTDITVSVDAK